MIDNTHTTETIEHEITDSQRGKGLIKASFCAMGVDIQKARREAATLISKAESVI